MEMPLGCGPTPIPFPTINSELSNADGTDFENLNNLLVANVFARSLLDVSVLCTIE
jgi:hypothetical protein